METDRHFNITGLRQRHFLRDGRLSFANGKSAGRITQSTRVQGPHEMVGQKYAVPKDKAVILHYESASIIEWFKKFVTYSSDNLEIIPFGFYKESIASINIAKAYYLKKKHVRQKEKESSGVADTNRYGRKTCKIPRDIG
eukprot:TRINITY_DN5923_c0_g1_i1.p1 TRINITY_DN5923_c0_g1~~TRINITY_DN5923_c0_g1_i1.p1  ORF type:complete len:140 (+),score=12.55 TRINITY_DN5923_c0_g1_i1:102-521(+)